ncbi:g10524 [Coccomyxa elongata]
MLADLSEQGDSQSTACQSNVTIDVGQEPILLETGEIGRQANGAVMLTCGKTVLYATACCTDHPVGDGSFTPLQVNYAERFSAAGRTSGGWLKRDGRPKDGEVLTARLVDRPLRPMFEPGWTNDTQVLIWVLSYDGINTPEPLAITAAAAALAISDIPLQKAVAGVRVGLLEGRGLVVNPTEQELQESSLDLMLAGTADALLMIEGYCDFLSEEQMVEAVRVGAEAVAKQCQAIEELRNRAGSPKRLETAHSTEALEARIETLCKADVEASYRNSAAKHERTAAVMAIQERVKSQLLEADSVQSASSLAEDDSVTEDLSVGTSGAQESTLSQFGRAFKHVEARVMRQMALEEDRRADGRACGQVRPITSRAGLLPSTHGSALFTRGETQTISVVTLGNEDDAQQVDNMALESASSRKFFLQYYFPPSSVGETGRVGMPSRREIGHGQLAERALTPIIPGAEEFPYTIRVESTVTESNGSSSMASVCGGYLALVDAGVPVSRPVAGVAMGLILEPSGQFRILTDILGSEDAMGDMDFKVAGDAENITAFQMDIKVEGITLDVLASALAEARKARQHILAEMTCCKPPPRGALAPNAPRIRRFTVDTDKLGMLIGPGGRNIRGLIEESGADEIKIIDNMKGLVEIMASSDEIADKAQQMVGRVLEDPEPGRIYRDAKVKSLEKFGLFVEILPGKEGLVHTSELDVNRSISVDSFNVGDTMDVKLMEVLDNGKLKLSRKAVQVAGGAEDVPLEQPEVGKIYRDCEVINIAPFGVFVEVLPNVSGLVHVSELDIGRSEVDDWAVGDTMDVKCLELMAGGKLKLSRRAVLLDDGGVAPRTPSMSPSPSIRTPPASPKTPTASPAAAPEVGRVYKDAVVKALQSTGLIVEVAPGIEGAVHMSELDVTFNPDLRCWQPGDTMDVKLLEVLDDGKVRLSRKAALLDQLGISYSDDTALQSEAPEAPEVGKIYRDAIVAGVSNFGLFVEIAPGVRGLCHISELDINRTPSTDAWENGDVITVKLIEVLKDGKLKLSRRAALLEDGGSRDEPPVGALVRDAPIKNVADFGVFVKISPGVKGLVHRSELVIRDDEAVADRFQVGDRIDVKVLEPLDDRRLALSQRAAQEAAAAWT